jgi:hypothetical protein
MLMRLLFMAVALPITQGSTLKVDRVNELEIELNADSLCIRWIEILLSNFNSTGYASMEIKQHAI